MHACVSHICRGLLAMLFWAFLTWFSPIFFSLVLGMWEELFSVLQPEQTHEGSLWGAPLQMCLLQQGEAKPWLMPAPQPVPLFVLCCAQHLTALREGGSILFEETIYCLSGYPDEYLFWVPLCVEVTGQTGSGLCASAPHLTWNLCSIPAWELLQG